MQAKSLTKVAITQNNWSQGHSSYIDCLVSSIWKWWSESGSSSSIKIWRVSCLKVKRFSPLLQATRSSLFSLAKFTSSRQCCSTWRISIRNPQMTVKMRVITWSWKVLFKFFLKDSASSKMIRHLQNSYSVPSFRGTWKMLKFAISYSRWWSWARASRLQI